jgi:hypothetical protein
MSQQPRIVAGKGGSPNLCFEDTDEPMRARIENQVLFLHKDDVPQYKKKGSVVRNTYFWTMRSIADYAPFDREWEYASEVWLALKRVLLSYAESGYLYTSEIILEFPPSQPEIPEVFRDVATWAAEDPAAEAEAEAED